MSGRSVIVIGGGVIGTACAFYLCRSGWRVTIVERGQFGQGASHANCGFVCPSHVLPLAEPGVIWKTLKAMLARNSAFYIKPRLDFRLFSWLWRFMRRCNRTDMMQAGEAIRPLLDSSLTLYRELIPKERLDCEWEMRGLLFVYRTLKEMDAYAATDRLLRESFGHPAIRYDGEAVTQLEPALKSGLAGGWLYEHDGHLRPDKLMSSWRQLLEREGVVIREGSGVRDLVREAGQAQAVELDDGTRLAADAVVVATGALTPFLEKALGCRIPIQPGKGYSITMPRPEKCPVIPMIFPEHRVAVTPMQTGYRIGSTMEFAGYDTSINPKRLSLLKEGASHYLQQPYCEPVQEEWYGWRPMTYDSMPIIDRSPALANVLIAAGHSMLGLSMAPATGKLVAEMLNGEKPHVDVAAYTVRRFG